jgi:hypothetical protein
MSKRTLYWGLAGLAPVVLVLIVWTIIAWANYLQAPSTYGGPSIDASGKVVVGLKRQDNSAPLITSAVTLALGIGWVVLLSLWKRAPAEDPNLPSAGERGRVRPR